MSEWLVLGLIGCQRLPNGEKTRDVGSPRSEMGTVKLKTGSCNPTTFHLFGYDCWPGFLA